MQYHLTFDSPSGPGREFLLTGLEYDSSSSSLGLKRLPGDPLSINSLYAPAAAAPRVAAVAVDDEGRLYLGDPSGRGILRVALDASGTPESVERWPAGLPGKLRASMRPFALLCGERGLIWVAERESNRVPLFDVATGAPRGVARAPFDAPSFLAADSSGRVYVSDNSAVWRFAPDGGPAPFATPIKIDGAGVGAAFAILPEIGDCQGETLVVASGATLLRFDLNGNPIAWRKQQLALSLLPARDDKSLDLLDTLLAVDLANARSKHALTTASAPARSGRVTAMAAWDNKLWIGLVDDPDAQAPARLQMLDPRALELALVTSAEMADVRIGGLAVANDEIRRGCRKLGGRMLVHDPERARVVALLAGAARQVQGALVAGPFEDVGGLGRWYRLRSRGARPSTARFKFLTLTTDPGGKSANPKNLVDLLSTMPPPAPPWYLTKGPLPPGDNENALEPIDESGSDLMTADPADAPFWTDLSTWREAADDAFDTRVWHRPASPQGTPFQLWVAAFLRGDGTESGSPTLGPLTVEAGHRGWEADLPAIYQRDSLATALQQGDSTASLPPPTLLDGLLGLFEAAEEGVDQAINNIPTWFDPRLTSDPQGLARHLGIDPRGLPDERLRAALASFSEVASVRGTAGGLERAIKDETGISVRLVEPIQSTSLWVLGSTGALGGRTGLAPGPIQGALLDKTATLDEARLIDSDDRGASLWDDVVGRLIVKVFAGQVSTLAALQALERSLRNRAPAHSNFAVQVVDARARLGYQATLGSDAVLARRGEGRAPLALGEALGPDHPLESPKPARPGDAAWLGHDTVS